MSAVAPAARDRGRLREARPAAPRDLLCEIRAVVRREPRVLDAAADESRARMSARRSRTSTPVLSSTSRRANHRFDASLLYPCGRTASTVRCGGGRKSRQSARPCTQAPPADPTAADGRTRPRPRAKGRTLGACFAPASGSPPDGWSGARCGRSGGVRPAGWLVSACLRLRSSVPLTARARRSSIPSIWRTLAWDARSSREGACRADRRRGGGALLVS